MGASVNSKRPFHHVGLSITLGIYTFWRSPARSAHPGKHFTSDKTWPGPDVPISIDPRELKELVEEAELFSALGGQKEIHQEEQPTIDFAYACVVTTRIFCR